MKKQVGRPPEKRQRIGPRKILRSKKDKKTCPGLGQGRKRGNAAHDERPAAAGAACRAYAGPYPAPAHKTGACIRPHTAKIRSGHKRTSGTPLLGRRPAHDHTASPPPEAAPAGCRPGRRRMSALAGRGSAGYNGGGQCSRTQAVVCKLYTGKDYRADSHVSVASRWQTHKIRSTRTLRTTIFIPRPRG